MLLVHLSLAPAESIQKLEGTDSIPACLQVIENSLKAKRNTLKIFCVRRHLVDGSSEISNEEKCLKK